MAAGGGTSWPPDLLRDPGPAGPPTGPQAPHLQNQDPPPKSHPSHVPQRTLSAPSAHRHRSSSSHHPHPAASLLSSPQPPFPFLYFLHSITVMPPLYPGPPSNVGLGPLSMPPGTQKLIIRTPIRRCSDLRATGVSPIPPPSVFLESRDDPGMMLGCGWVLGGPQGPGKRLQVAQEGPRAYSQV